MEHGEARGNRFRRSLTSWNAEVARIFVSHASEDTALATVLHQWLVDAGQEVFLDSELRGGLVVGDEWQPRLLERLRWADAVVCLVSSAYLASVWCSAEIGIAQSRGSRILPLLVESGLHHPLLAASQYADYAADSSAALASLREALRRIDAAGGWGWQDGRNPFPGLQSFDADLHQAFFGRNEEIANLVSTVRSPAVPAEAGLVVVVGPSGCGKSSLVRAGLVPAIAGDSDWLTLAAFLPGRDPLGALAGELAAVGRRLGMAWTLLAVVRERLASGSGLVALANELLVAASGQYRPRHLLVLVDQFEELLTQADAATRRTFVEVLRPALSGPLRVLATVRTASLHSLLSSPEFDRLPVQTFPLRPLRSEMLSTVIQGPARLAGIEVDDALVSRLVADTGGGEALPLLAFTLSELAQDVGRGGCLSASRYEKLGGVRGALQLQADAALATACRASGRGPQEVIAGLLRLVTVDERGEPTRWRVRRDELPDPVRTELDAFVARRLLTTDADENGNVLVRVAHEALLSAWPKLADAIRATASGLRARREVERAAGEWSETGRSRQHLWDGNRLGGAVDAVGARWRLWHRGGVLSTDRVELSPRAREFLGSSILWDRLRRARAVAVLSALLVLATTAGAGALVFERQAVQERDHVTAELIAGEAAGLETSDPSLAKQLSVVAYRLDHEAGISGVFASQQLPGSLDAEQPSLDLAISGDGRRVAISTGSGVVVDDLHGSPVGRIDGLTTGPVALSRNGRLLAAAVEPDGSGGAGALVRLWTVDDLGRPHAIASLPANADRVAALAISADGQVLAAGMASGEIRVWDVTNPRTVGEPRSLPGHAGGVDSLAFPLAGRLLASSGDDRLVRLWDLTGTASAPLLSKIEGLPDVHPTALVKGQVFHRVAFAPDGQSLATVGKGLEGDDVRIWDVRDPRQPHLLPVPPTDDPVKDTNFACDGVVALAFRPTGGLLGAACSGRVQLFKYLDLKDLVKAATLPATGGSGSGLAFGTGGSQILFANHDGVQVWDALDPWRPGAAGSLPLTPGGFQTGLAFAHRHGRWLLGAVGNNGVQLWDTTSVERPAILANLPSAGLLGGAVAFSPDASLFAASAVDGSSNPVVRIRRTDDPSADPVGTITDLTAGTEALAFSPDGRVLAVADLYEYGTVPSFLRLYSVVDPAHPRPLATLPATVFRLAFSRGGHLLVGGSDDSLLTWDVTDPSRPEVLEPKLLTTNSYYMTPVFSDDGRRLVVGDTAGAVHMWPIDHDRLTGSPTVVAHGQLSGGRLALDPDGTRFAVVSTQDSPLGSGHVELWNVGSGGLEASLAYSSDVTAVAFRPDGQYLATMGEGVVDLWDLNADRVAIGLCASIGDVITPAQWRRYVPDQPYRPPCR
ncbi:MAG TPA: TIR domain-containing protein [Candidatus Dormibacteraeota bacterium]|nr:TIR domain-containing protein [Candidatus Dormibacteraeota bacterium]